MTLRTRLRNAAPRLQGERGIALAIAIFSIVIIGMLVAGVFYGSYLEQKSGENTRYARQAFEAAEAGMAGTFDSWDQSVYGTFPVDTPQALASVTVGRTRYTPSITRLSSGLYLVEASGEQLDGAGGILSRRRLGTLSRLTPTIVDVQAAVTAKGNVRIGGNSTVDGNDHIPDGWGGCSLGPSKAGVRTDGLLTLLGGGTAAGTPPARVGDSTVVDSLFSNPFNELKAMRNITLSSESNNGMVPATTGTPLRCNRALELNWGEPWYNPPATGVVPQCQGYFPIIYRNGNLKVQNGRGQGVLLVEGDLEIRGNFEFTGLVITTGEVKANGTGNKVTGGVLARNADLGDLTTFTGNPVVNFSACAVSRALNSSARVRPLAERSWTELFN